MNRRHFAVLLGAVTTCLVLPPAHAEPQGNSGNHGHGDDGDDQGHGNGKGRGKGHDRDDNGHGNGNGNGKHYDKRYFRDQDNAYLVRYYDGPRDLPPGLRKKYYRNQVLPPSWQQRFRPMPQQVIVTLPPVPYGYQRGYYDGYAVVVDPRTRIIVDAVDIVSALSGR